MVFKLLTMLHWGSYSWLTRSSLSCTLRIGKAAKHFHLRNSRLIEYLKWLEEQGYLTNLKVDKWDASFELARPPSMKSINLRVRNRQFKAL